MTDKKPSIKSKNLGTVMNSLIWELDWIMRNLNLYDSASHALQVMVNITNRYYRNALIAKIKKRRTKNVKRICGYRRVEKHS